MSAEHDSQPTATDRTLSSGRSGQERARADYRAERTVKGAKPSSTKTQRTATIDRGGSPLENPSDTHRTVAARERLWDSYRGGDDDGQFVWTGPSAPGGPWEG